MTAVPVTVTISPQNTPPTVSYGKVKLLVTATYTATYNDAEGDAPTYTITTTPTKGTPDLDPARNIRLRVDLTWSP